MADATVFDKIIERYGRGEEGPGLFVREMLGAVPEDYQDQLLRAVGRGERKISIRSGHGTGKSTALSWAMLWFVLFRFPNKVVVTAPTTAQLYDAMFAELKRWIGQLPDGLKCLLDVKADRVELVAAPSEAFISARTSRAEQPEALAGVHAQNVMLVVDEASGVPEQVFEAASGSMSGHSAMTILAGNPTRNSGTFYNSHNKLAEYWHTMHWPCIGSRRVSNEFIEEMKLSYGEESNAYRVRVLGEFPDGDDDTIIPLSLAQSAVDRDIVTPSNQRPVWSIDVARFGSDRTVLARRSGNVITDIEAWRGLDTMQTVGKVKFYYDAMPINNRPGEIMVDDIGVGGGVVDRMRELGMPVRGINVSEVPSISGSYADLRTELIYRVKIWLEQRMCRLPNIPELITELTSIRYTFVSAGKMRAESKADMKKRRLKSPDLADAVFLSFAGDTATALGAPSANWSRPIRRGLMGVA